MVSVRFYFFDRNNIKTNGKEILQVTYQDGPSIYHQDLSCLPFFWINIRFTGTKDTLKEAFQHEEMFTHEWDARKEGTKNVQINSDKSDYYNS